MEGIVQAYDYTIQHTTGVNYPADALSRRKYEGQADPELDQVHTLQVLVIRHITHSYKWKDAAKTIPLLRKLMLKS